jgi:DsbC/DsbD-like thiol-disulfide interchange protein
MRGVKTVVALVMLAVAAVATAASAQEAAMSPWSRNAFASLRLIAGATAPSGKQRVGVEITMKPGYKTYWRSPGDFGVPPVFDWSGSVNVGGLDVRWPAPERFPDGAGFSLGYVGEVVIPVSVQPVDPTRPVMLSLKLDYAVCDKICIPAKGETQLWLEPGVTAVSAPRLEQFEKRVPVPVKLRHDKELASITEARLDDAAGASGLSFQVALPVGARLDDVFVEGPGMWSFAKPALSLQPDGTMLAKIRIKDRPKGASGPTPFIVTLRGSPQAVETRLELDIPAAKP